MFKQAVKYAAKLRLAIAGPSGSGKTYTALAIASNLGQRIALVDTEHGSASKYADTFTFDVMELRPPFHPDRFSEAVKEAEQAGYDVIILDSLSHAWNGAGGALELVEQYSKKYKGNSYAAWGDVTPIQNRLIEAIVGAGIHVIATMRSKQDYILIEKNGKQMPQKVGMAPVQRDGFEYEFDVMLDMDIENTGIVSKSRCSALAGKVINKPGADVAAILRDWLGGQTPTTATQTAQSAPAGKGRVLPSVMSPDEIPLAGRDEHALHITNGNTPTPVTQTAQPAPAVVSSNTPTAAPEPAGLPDDEQVIAEANAADFFRVIIAGSLITRYDDNIHALKQAAKNLGYTAIPKTMAGRLEMYRAIKTHAAERDAAERDTANAVPLFEDDSVDTSDGVPGAYDISHR